MLLFTHLCSSSSSLFLLPTRITFFKFKDGSSNQCKYTGTDQKAESQQVTGHQVMGWYKSESLTKTNIKTNNAH